MLVSTLEVLALKSAPWYPTLPITLRAISERLKAACEANLAAMKTIEAESEHSAIILE